MKILARQLRSKVPRNPDAKDEKHVLEILMMLVFLGNVYSQPRPSVYRNVKKIEECQNFASFRVLWATVGNPSMLATRQLVSP